MEFNSSAIIQNQARLPVLLLKKDTEVIGVTGSRHQMENTFQDSSLGSRIIKENITMILPSTD